MVFNSETGRRITRDVTATATSVLSSVGGSLGLCTGFSILSLAEMVYYLFRTAAAAASVGDRMPRERPRERQ